MNAEIDATIGPILHVHANRQGVHSLRVRRRRTGVQMNLYRWVRGLGLSRA